MSKQRDEDWSDFERSLMQVLERIADALEAQAPTNITINTPNATTTPLPNLPWVNS